MRNLLLILSFAFAIIARGDDHISEAVETWIRGADLSLSAWESVDAAEHFRRAFVEALENEFGPPIGFKAALTSPATQARFGVDRPILGTLLNEMIITNNSVVTVQTGRLLAEADLIVVIRDTSFNDAQDEYELVSSISHVAPFLELADGIFPLGQKPDVGNLVAYNAGARLGVRGALISLPENPDDALALLRGLSAALYGPDGEAIGRGSASALMGDPIRAVQWIRDAAHREGYRFVGGELLSLGSITPPLPARAQGDYEARYDGLPEHKARVRVTLIQP